MRWVLGRDPVSTRPARAYVCTDPTWRAATLLTAYQGRWTLEVIFEESQAHLGVGTQRQGSDLAIARSTPGVLGLYNVVALVGQVRHPTGQVPLAQAAWYPKAQATLRDGLVSVWLYLWAALIFYMPRPPRLV